MLRKGLMMMFYLEYEKSTGLVFEIHEEEPTDVKAGRAVAKSDSNLLELGLEIEFVITITMVDVDGNVTGLSTIKQVEPAYQLLKKIDELEKENQALKGSVADLWETILVAGGNA